MNRIISTLILILVVLSCNNIERPKKPDNLISKDKMVDVITDISLMNAAKGLDKDLLEKNAINPANYIYEKYNIDSTQFAASNNYYAYDVKEYEKIYIRVKERLENKKAEYRLFQEQEKKELDSIREDRKRERDSIKKLNINRNSDFKSIKEKLPDLPK
jgi:hypothetical protein